MFVISLKLKDWDKEINYLSELQSILNKNNHISSKHLLELEQIQLTIKDKMK
jgi:hypothetical protein